MCEECFDGALEDYPDLLETMETHESLGCKKLIDELYEIHSAGGAFHVYLEDNNDGILFDIKNYKYINYLLDNPTDFGEESILRHVRLANYVLLLSQKYPEDWQKYFWGGVFNHGDRYAKSSFEDVNYQQVNRDVLFSGLYVMWKNDGG